MSTCTIPLGADGKVEVGKRKADGMTTEIKSLDFRPPLSTFRFSKGGVGKPGGFTNTSDDPRAGGAVVLPGGITNRLEADWGLGRRIGIA
jgi:hypothetical protein